MSINLYLGATDEPDGAQAGPVGVEGLHPRLYHLRVAGQPQIVVGTEVQDGWGEEGEESRGEEGEESRGEEGEESRGEEGEESRGE